MTKKKSRKANKMDLEEVNENFREGQDDDAKINIVVGMPEIDAVSPQVVETAGATPAKQQEQIPLDPPQQSAPQPEVLHSGRMALRRGVEQKLIEDSINNSLSPMKSRSVKNQDVYTRLYAEHQEKLIKENLIKSANEDSPQKIVISTKPPPRVWELVKDLLKKREEAVEKDKLEKKRECHPQIDEISRQLADRSDPTPDRRAFGGDKAIVPGPRHDLTLEERTKIELDRNHYSFHPQTTLLDPAILAPSPGGGTLSSTAPGTSAASSISTPKRTSKDGNASESPPGGGTTGTGANAEPAFKRLLEKGEALKKRKEARREKYIEEEKSEVHDPHLDPNSLRIAAGNSHFLDSLKMWVSNHQLNIKKANGTTQTSITTGVDEDGNVLDWGERGSWIGKTTWHKSKDDEESKEVRPPQINSPLPPHTEDEGQWIENIYGVKKFIERTELARRLKEEKPTPNPYRKWPRQPTVPREFNLSKTNKISQQKEDESFESFST